MCAYDYELTLPEGRRDQVRLRGFPLVNEPGEYQARTEASISAKVMYGLADGEEVSSAVVALTCTAAEQRSMLKHPYPGREARDLDTRPGPEFRPGTGERCYVQTQSERIIN